MGWVGPITHRQYKAWEEWQIMDKNKPSRTDHYLMQIAYHVAAVPNSMFSTQPPLFTLDNFHIPFTVKRGSARPAVGSGRTEPYDPERSEKEFLAMMGASKVKLKPGKPPTGPLKDPNDV